MYCLVPDVYFTAFAKRLLVSVKIYKIYMYSGVLQLLRKT